MPALPAATRRVDRYLSYNTSAALLPHLTCREDNTRAAGREIPGAWEPPGLASLVLLTLSDDLITRSEETMCPLCQALALLVSTLGAAAGVIVAIRHWRTAVLRWAFVSTQHRVGERRV